MTMAPEAMDAPMEQADLGDFMDEDLLGASGSSVGVPEAPGPQQKRGKNLAGSGGKSLAGSGSGGAGAASGGNNGGKPRKGGNKDGKRHCHLCESWLLLSAFPSGKGHCGVCNNALRNITTAARQQGKEEWWQQIKEDPKRLKETLKEYRVPA